jgi:hypothetical protein
MRAGPIDVLCHVAVVAQELKIVREAISLNLTVDALVIAHYPTMSTAAPMHMIQRQELHRGLTTTSTRIAVSPKHSLATGHPNGLSPIVKARAAVAVVLRALGPIGQHHMLDVVLGERLGLSTFQADLLDPIVLAGRHQPHVPWW